MFIGHFAVGFAAKKFAPRSSEAALVAAPLLAHIRIDPSNTRFTPFVSYPWSRSLLMLCVWLHVANSFGPAPDAVTEVASAAIALRPWACWFNRHRSNRGELS
jgi:hypothetical protein